jgi:outer membrane protein TolC
LVAQASTAAPLSLRQVVDAALGANPQLGVARAQVQEADAMLAQSEGARLPRVNLSLSATRSNEALTAFGFQLAQQQVTAEAMSPAVLNNPSEKSHFNPRIEVDLPLYTGGQLSARQQQGRAMTQAARQDEAVSRQAVIAQAVESYQGVHAARAAVKVARQALMTAEESVRVTRQMQRQGLAVKSDVLTAQVAHEDAKARLGEAERMEARALDAVNLVMAQPLTQALDVGVAIQLKPLSEAGEKLAQTALAQHPQLHALRARRDAARAELEAARGARRPQVGLLARQEWAGSQPGFDAGSYTVGATVSWNAFDGGVKHAGVDRAQAGLLALDAQIRQAEDGVLFALRDAERRVALADAQAVARAAAVQDAEESERISKLRYQNGVAALVEWLGAQTRLDQVRAAMVAAQNEQVVSQVAVRRAAGLLSPESL